MTGWTDSSGLATTGAYQTTFVGGTYPADDDAFVAKLNAAGSELVYFTYLGGNGEDEGRDVAVDSSGNAYVTGYTQSSGLATPGAYKTTYSAYSSDDGDAFVAKVNPTGSGLVYFTYLGGSFDNRGNGIAVDGAGNAYVTGDILRRTTPGAYQTTYVEIEDAFVAKVNSTGSGLAYFHLSRRRQ